LSIVTEFAVTVIWSGYFADDAPGSILRVLNYDLYFKDGGDLDEFLGYIESFSIETFFYIDWARVFRIIILTPVVEEFVFRGLLLSTILHR
jgi:membrane protease YdiL (CAAX protease family)